MSETDLEELHDVAISVAQVLDELSSETDLTELADVAISTAQVLAELSNGPQ